VVTKTVCLLSFFKKNFLLALVGRKKLHPAQMELIKNSCTAVRKKKNVTKLFPHSKSFTKPQQNTQKKLLLHISNVYYYNQHIKKYDCCFRVACD